MYEVRTNEIAAFANKLRIELKYIIYLRPT